MTEKLACATQKWGNCRVQSQMCPSYLGEILDLAATPYQLRGTHSQDLPTRTSTTRYGVYQFKRPPCNIEALSTKAEIHSVCLITTPKLHGQVHPIGRRNYHLSGYVGYHHLPSPWRVLPPTSFPAVVSPATTVVSRLVPPKPPSTAAREQIPLTLEP